MKKNFNSWENNNNRPSSESDDEPTQEDEINSMNNFQNISQNLNLLLIIKRAYYINKINEIERYLDSIYNLKNKNLTLKEQKKLCLYFNKLSNFENLYISIEDYYKSLTLQKRIVNILKNYIINNIG